MNHKPDIFGKYSYKMNELHVAIGKKVIVKTKLDINNLEILILQCTFGEYLNESHTHEYHHAKFDFLEKEKPILVSINPAFFSSPENDLRVLNQFIEGSWQTIHNGKIIFNAIISSPENLKWPSCEMVQSVHFLYKNKKLLSQKKDYQMFKIIYPYGSLEPILNKIENDN